MRNSSNGQPLQSMAFEWHPLPTVIEHDGPEAWCLWAACVRELDNPQDMAAQRLANLIQALENP